MNTINKNAAGVAVGTVGALVHALLAVSVWAMPEITQKLVTFNLAIHFMKMDVMVQPFSWVSAAILVILGFCVGYVVGCILATVYNRCVQ